MDDERMIGLLKDTSDGVIEELCAVLDDINSRLVDVRGRQDGARDLRMCRWAGQSLDGRKHGKELGQEEVDVAPFEGAPDLKVRLADNIISEGVDVLMQSFDRAKIQAQPMESGDTLDAGNATLLLRWLRDVRLVDRLRAEVELSANYMLGDDPGVAVIGTFWSRSDALESEDYTVDTIAELSVRLLGFEPNMQNYMEIVQQHRMVLIGEAYQELAIQLLTKVFPDEPLSALNKALNKLRKGQRVTLRNRYPVENEPVIITYRPGVDIFFDPDATDLARQTVFVREELTDLELSSRVGSANYNKPEVADVLKNQRGVSILSSDARESASGNQSVPPNLYEVFYCYRWILDEKTWLPQMYCTVFHYGAKAVLKHEPYAYPHVGGPFVAISRERKERYLLDARGITAVTDSEQWELKTQRDSFGAYTMLSTLPPFLRHVRRHGAKIALAPGAQIDIQRADDFSWLKPPQFPTGSVEMQRMVKEQVDEYFGRNGKSDLASVRIQGLVIRFLSGWASVFARVLACAQRWMTPVMISGIAGVQVQQMNKQAIRDARDVVATFDPNDLNMDYLLKKLKLISDMIVPLDRKATIDYTPIVSWAFGSLDQRLASLSIRDEKAAADDERKETEKAMQDLYFGFEPIVPDRGANWELRIQAVDQMLGGTGEFARKYTEDPDFRQRVTAYRAQLATLYEQYVVNPQRGRNVTPKVLEG